MPETYEDPEKYRPGGYHPVLIHDLLSDGRYEVLHKIGHGGFATVWLAWDDNENRPVALDILPADSPRDCNEIKIHLHLQKQGSCAELAAAGITPLLDFFEAQSANGNHVCLVLPSLGPSLASLQRGVGYHMIRPDVAHKLALRILQYRIFTQEESYWEVSRRLYLFTDHHSTDYRCQLRKYLVPIEAITAMDFGRCSQLSWRTYLVSAGTQ